ncbi:hypothetical protein [Enterococcus sp. AZ103]
MSQPENTLRDFLLGLHLIYLKLKKPPDQIKVPERADNAVKVGDLKSR